MTENRFDALLWVSFGGPESIDEVMPFLRHVTQGRGVPDERLVQIAEHYYHFGGVSPINAQNRALIARLSAAMSKGDMPLPIYWGNRHAQPFLREAVAAITEAKHQNVLVILTSAYSSYSGCRQYRDALDAELREAGAAWTYEKLPVFFDHPLFIAAWKKSIEPTLQNGPYDYTLFTAHSIPVSMAAGCAYETQLREAMRLVVEATEGAIDAHELVYQSRSGAPGVPWLEPDVGARLRELAASGKKRVLVVPLGFLSDHMEVVWDLDHELAQVANTLGVDLVRAQTPSQKDEFIEMLMDMIARASRKEKTAMLSTLGRNPEPCSNTCCPRPALRRPA